MTKFYHNASYTDTLKTLNDEIAETLIPAMVYLGFLIVIGAVGNLLVCYIFLFRLRMGTQHFLIITLAVFDLLSCFIAMPTEIADMRHFLTFENEFACRLMRFVTSYCSFASILTLIVIAVDRYRKVCHPLARQMSMRHVKMAVGIVLTLALLYAIPAPILYGIRSSDTEYPGIHGHDCSTSDSVQGTMFPIVYNSILFLSFIVILLSLTIIYVKIWREMRRHNRYMARNAKLNTNYQYSVSEVSSPSHYTRQSRRRKGNNKNNRSPDNNGSHVHSGNSHSPNNEVDLSDTDRPQDGLPCCDARFRFGSSEITTNLDFKRTSINSDNTYCYDTDTESNSIKMVQNRRRSSPAIITVCNRDPITEIISVSSSVKSDGSGLPTDPNLQEIFPNQYFPHFEVPRGEIQLSLKGTVVDPDLLGASNYVEIARTDSLQQKKQHTVVLADEGIHDCEVVTVMTEEDSTVISKEGTVSAGTSDAAHHHEVHQTIDDTDECQLRFAQHRTENLEGNVRDPLTTDLFDVKDIGGVVSDAKTDYDSDVFEIVPNLLEEHNTSPKMDRKCAPPLTAFKNQQFTTAAMLTANDFKHFSDRGFGHTRQQSLPSIITEKNKKTSDDSRRMSLPTRMDKEPPMKNTQDNTESSLSTNQTQNYAMEKHRNRNNVLIDTHAADNTVNATRIRDQNLTLKISVTAVKSYTATVIAMSVTVAFFLSFVPHLSLITARIINDFDTGLRGAPLVLYNIFLRSYFINSVSNPIIYGVQNVRFRRECARLLQGVVSLLRQKINPLHR